MKKYIYLSTVIVLIYVFQSFFNATGGIGADSLSYFGIASDLPRLETNLFPLGFPVVIRFFYEIFGDYFWASKMLNVSMVIILLLFSYFKKYYFKETVLLFTGKTLFFALNYAVSEGLFVFMLYFLIYLFHERFQNRMKPMFFVIFSSLLFIVLFSIRYSGIYIFLGFGVFWMVMFFKNRFSPINKDFLTVLLWSGSGIFAYLLFNLYNYGSFTGENLRGAPAQYYPVYIFRDILGVTNVVDPFIGIKPASNSFASLTFQVILMVFDLFLLRYFIILVKRKKTLIDLDFHLLLWIFSGVYTFAVFASGYFQQIEEMNVRMLAAANFVLFFSFLLIYFKNLKSDKPLFMTASFFLVFLTFYSLKMPENYFKNRKQVEPQMSKFDHKKYIFNNEEGVNVSLTTYHFPLINKSFQYQHTTNQKGDIKRAIAGTINPQIKWLKYDTIQDKRQVLYTSEIILK
jgi:hypothetical protein